MERWKAILLIIGIIICFLVVGYFEDPADYEVSEAHKQVHEYIIPERR